ncbi:Tim44 domain-containing protein [Chelativorans sp. J32]|uniref:Tim44 domain-containing protein n=1 Tax=Chelativorans sp. J32 TaxID=935840 RepID=UPI0004B82D77|nr:Tim44 domain-containing protein [Chelativorans sp. J32]
MMRFGRFRFIALLSAAFVAMTLVSVDFAEARRGGSFGSRGLRTQQTVPPTRTAPNQTGPVERSMTPAPNAATRQQQTMGQQQRPGLFNGLGGGLMRGILIGGLFGMLLGYGFGGMAGVLGFLVQLLLIGALIWLAMAFFRSRSQPAVAGGAPAPEPARGPDFGQRSQRDAAPRSAPARSSAGFTLPRIGGGGAVAATPQMTDITLDPADLDVFERRLGEVQRAFADEDHAALRRLSTPEMVSYFSEELADNAKRGVRNEVSGVRLLQADIAEAWNEGEEDYATAAFRYEAIDVLRDRVTGALAGGVEEPTETVELWTFVRKNGGEWKLSAIQDVDAQGA